MSLTSWLNQEAEAWLEDLLHTFWKNRHERPTDVERRVLYVAALIAEVNNGGFDQFFLNPGGDHTEETLEALRAIGAVKTYELLRDACSFFPGGMPGKTEEERDAQLIALRGEEPFPEFERLDRQFYERTEDLPLLLQTMWQREVPVSSRE